MKKLQRKLPYPITEQDKAFMKYLLEGVRRKREEATRQTRPSNTTTPGTRGK